MKLSELTNLASFQPLKNSGTRMEESSDDQAINFSDYLKNALSEVDDLQKQAATSAEKLAAGDQDYLHNTIIAYEKANLALELTVEVRNKIVEAYQEIMRIQI